MDWIAFFSGVSTVAMVLFISGLVLVTIEMFIPGFGVAGITGAICLILAVIFAADNIIEGIIFMLIILVILSILFAVVLMSLSKGKMKKTLVLNDEQTKEKGFISSADLEYFIDKEGTALTDLRPAGRADIEGLKLDVTSDGEYILAGSPIKIFKVNGSKIIVQKIRNNN